jgi:hypothetical protein
MNQYQTIGGESVRLGFADEPEVDPLIIDHANGSHVEFKDGNWNAYDIEGYLQSISSPGTPEYQKWQDIHRILTGH